MLAQGFGEVEIHLHHDNDTPENLRALRLDRGGRRPFSDKHGLPVAQPSHRASLAYAFIHGNWALCNARPDAWHCGVDHEIPILLETGCYADFTFPSAPSATQPPIINRIYWAADRPGGPRSQDVETADPANALLMVQGPLLLNWRRRKWGIVPQVENACLQSTQLPSIERLPHWLQARVQVPARRDWFFVKLHAHGAPEHDHETLLGAPMVRFHEELGEPRPRESEVSTSITYPSARRWRTRRGAAYAGYQGPWRKAARLGNSCRIFGERQSLTRLSRSSL